MKQVAKSSKVKISPSKEVVVLKDPGLERTRSGMILPSSQGKQKPEVGIVVAIGIGKKPLDFKVGDKLVYRKYMESKIFVQTEEFNFIEFKDIMGKVN